MRVSFFVTCVVDLLAPDTRHAAVDVLEAAGHEVSFAADQTCCGQPAWNAGATGPAATVAATSLRALVDDDADAVVAPAGSCATMMKLFWPQLFDQVGDAAAAEAAEALAGRVHEFSEFLHAEGLPLLRIQGEAIAYYRSCHMLRELRLHDEPEGSLRRAGCELAPWDDDERCCGFGASSRSSCWRRGWRWPTRSSTACPWTSSSGRTPRACCPWRLVPIVADALCGPATSPTYWPIGSTARSDRDDGGRRRPPRARRITQRRRPRPIVSDHD